MDCAKTGVENGLNGDVYVIWTRLHSMPRMIQFDLSYCYVTIMCGCHDNNLCDKYDFVLVWAADASDEHHYVLTIDGVKHILKPTHEFERFEDSLRRNFTLSFPIVSINDLSGWHCYAIHISFVKHIAKWNSQESRKWTQARVRIDLAMNILVF